METNVVLASERIERAGNATAFAWSYWFGFPGVPPASLVGREVLPPPTA